MASGKWGAPDTIVYRLTKEAREFSFFQAVWLLEAAYRKVTSIDEKLTPDGEVIRFCANASLSFPIADIDSIERVEDADHGSPVYRIAVNFLGLYGPSSPLPPTYTVEVMRDETGNQKDFLDLFNHRLLALFYRCWKKYRFYLTYEPGARDRLSQNLFALIGLRPPELRPSTGIDWLRLLPFAGLLGMRAHSATLVSQVISGYFDGLAVAVHQNVPRRVCIREEQRVELGRRNYRLGTNTVIGEDIADRAGKFRMILGPAPFAELAQYMEGGARHRVLHELVRFVVADQLDFDVEFAFTSAPVLMLTDDCQCRLGCSSWLGECGTESGLALLERN